MGGILATLGCVFVVMLLLYLSSFEKGVEKNKVDNQKEKE